jgi:hypothetical protein
VQTDTNAFHTSTVTKRKIEPYTVRPGYLILQNAKQDPRRLDFANEEEAQGFRDATALVKKVFYYLAQSSINTPFGYYTTPDRVDDLAEKLNELRIILEPIKRRWGFRHEIAHIVVPVNSGDPNLVRDLAQFTIDKLTDLREKLLSDKKVKVFVYTQDSTERLGIFSQGSYGRIVDRAINHAKNEVAAKRKNPNYVPYTDPIDEAIATFERWVEKCSIN